MVHRSAGAEEAGVTMSGRRQAILAALEPWLEQHRRDAWRPVTEPRDGPLVASKFGGAPWLAADERWPTCGGCGKPLQLFLQLNLDTLPPSIGGAFGSGLLQLFYCVRPVDFTRGGRMPTPEEYRAETLRFGNDDCNAAIFGGFDPAGGGKLVRVVHPRGSSASNPAPSTGTFFDAQTIVGWDRIDDWPHQEESEKLGLAFEYDFAARTVSVSWAQGAYQSAPLPYEELEGEDGQLLLGPQSRDKLAGWPAWVQGVEYPACRVCGETMRLVFQIDSDDHVPFVFGDVGTGHITQCPHHPDVVAFGWACS